MSDSPFSSNIANMAAERARRKGGTTGDGMPPDDTIQRVAALEKGMAEMKTDLAEVRRDQHAAALALEGLRGDMKAGFAKIDGTLEAIKASLEAKATKADLTPIGTSLGTLDGRVSNIPTFWQNIGVIAALLIGLAGVSFTISKLNAPQPLPPQTSTPGPAQGKAP